MHCNLSLLLELSTMAAIGTVIITKSPHCRMSVKPRAAFVRNNYKLPVAYELKLGQSRHFHKLPSGLNMEIIFQKGHHQNEEKAQSPPLVFVHGSFHAAWCWAEHWLPFFSRHGFDCYALSLLAQGESDSPDGAVAVSEENTHPHLAGAVLVCSVPPSGNSSLVWRYLFSKPIAAFKVTRSLAAKAFQTSLPLCRETFFSAAMEDHLVLRYQKLMTEGSWKPLFDLRKLNASLPVPPVKDPCMKILVLGASDDFIVDAEGLRETGRFYGVSPVCVEGVAHDMMLDCSWEKGAQLILSWLHALDREQPPQ